MDGEDEVLVGEETPALVPPRTPAVRAQNAIRAAAAILTRLRTKPELAGYAGGAGTGLSGTTRAARQPRAVGAVDGARVRHADEQPIRDHACRDLDGQRQT